MLVGNRANWIVELNLTGNHINQIPALSNDKFKNIKVLILAENNISSITVDIFSKSLQVLQLHNNSVSRLDSSVIEYLRGENLTLNSLTLHNNPWICDCEEREMLNLVHELITKSNFNVKMIYCNNFNKYMIELSLTELCTYGNNIVFISVTVVGIVLFLTVVSLILCWYYQHNVKTLAYFWCNCLLPEVKRNGEKYDAFISFSHQDEDFVIDELVKKLEVETDTPYRLCLHTRDWAPGEWIPEQIYKSVDLSRRTIIVLSENFLASKWSLAEFRYAHKKAIENNSPSVIILLYNINVNELLDDIDSDLQFYLKNNTYITWGEPCFWAKLKTALGKASKQDLNQEILNNTQN